MFKNLISFLKKKEPSDIVYLDGLDNLRKYFHHTNENAIYYNKKTKELTIVYTDGRTHNCNFPYEFINGLEFKFLKSTKPNRFVIETYNTFLIDIIKIEMKQAGIKASVKKVTQDLYYIKPKTEEDRAMFSLYFNDYVNYKPKEYIVNNGVGAGGAGIVVTYTISGSGGGGGSSIGP
jgi:hypothetical protein